MTSLVGTIASFIGVCLILRASHSRDMYELVSGLLSFLIGGVAAWHSRAEFGPSWWSTLLDNLLKINPWLWFIVGLVAVVGAPKDFSPTGEIIGGIFAAAGAAVLWLRWRGVKP